EPSLIDRRSLQLNKRVAVVVLLYDGYQTFLQYEGAIAAIGARSKEIELWAVGDLAEIEARLGSSTSCRLLFPQKADSYYNARLLLQAGKHIAFQSRIAKF